MGEQRIVSHRLHPHRDVRSSSAAKARKEGLVSLEACRVGAHRVRYLQDRRRVRSPVTLGLGQVPVRRDTETWDPWGVALRMQLSALQAGLLASDGDGARASMQLLGCMLQVSTAMLGRVEATNWRQPVRSEVTNPQAAQSR
jgi:hypothetical protein